MYLNGKIIILLAIVLLQAIRAQETEDSEITTVPTILNEKSSETQLDSKLRTALLKALTDLEHEESNDDDDDKERNIEKARASAITIFSNAPEESSTDKTKSEEDPAKQKAPIVVLQKSDAFQSHTVTSPEKNALDTLKEAEQIITSASNNFASTPSTTKITSYSNLNTILDSESKIPTAGERYSIGKAVEEPSFVKTFVRPLGSSLNDDLPSSTIKSITDKLENNEKPVEATTQSVVEVATEENEAKVEQVQLFSAPLVAAFTVHQDEKGQPKKVEPIYKNGLTSKKAQLAPIVQKPAIAQPSQSILQSSLFNSLGIQQKQQILEQELEKLRNQQNSILAEPDLDLNAQRFNQAVNLNFNQFDPVFTEPDRSIVTNLATIDPSNLVERNVQPILSRFMPVNNPNQIISEPKPNFRGTGDISFVPSISFDPLLEAGRLPKNGQILPNKEPRGFHSYVKLPTINSLVPAPTFTPFSVPANLVANQNRFLRQEQNTNNNVGFKQNTFSIVPAHQPYAPRHELSYFPSNKLQLVSNNKFFRSPQTSQVQQSIQPFEIQNRIPPNNRFLRSNQEPVLQNYRYSSSFGFPLH